MRYRILHLIPFFVIPLLLLIPSPCGRRKTTPLQCSRCRTSRSRNPSEKSRSGSKAKATARSFRSRMSCALDRSRKYRGDRRPFTLGLRHNDRSPRGRLDRTSLPQSAPFRRPRKTASRAVAHGARPSLRSALRRDPFSFTH